MTTLSDLEELENQVCNAIAEKIVLREAARAMLAALRDAQAYTDNARRFEGERYAMRATIDAAIAQAEAVGIKVQS